MVRGNHLDCQKLGFPLPVYQTMLVDLWAELERHSISIFLSDCYLFFLAYVSTPNNAHANMTCVCIVNEGDNLSPN